VVCTTTNGWHRCLRLLDHRITLLFKCDQEGNLIGKNEPWDPQKRDAPLVYVSWSQDAIVYGCRQDTPAYVRGGLASLAAGKARPPAIDDQSLAESVRRLFPASTHIEIIDPGPAYCFPALSTVPTDVVQVSRRNMARLANEVKNLDLEIDVAQPFIAKLVDGHVVSTCQTVRRAGIYVEAGVETRLKYRRRGFGKEVVSAWASKALNMGLVPLYSTSWSNLASLSLARSLGLVQYASEFSISEASS
jgi:GNAT superfamily N-acetyltransferase